MPRPQFSEVLVARRHELGLSIRQASQILRLREDVLVAFEEGDYEHLPQSGYAQGMLSSYARYLGLNAREIVDLFQEDLYQYRHGTSSHELRRRTRDTQAGRGVAGYELPNEAGSRPKAYVEYRPLLPTSGGPAGDMGAFATTAPARPRTSVPLASAPTADARSRYALTYGSGTSGRPEGAHPYNTDPSSERPSASTARRRSQTARRRRQDDSGSRLLNEGQRSYAQGRDDARENMPTGRLYRRDDVSTRRVRPSEYTDDLRLDGHASPYSPASTISGRRSSRNIASVERPNVRRRQGGRAVGGGRRPPRKGGAMGVVSQFLSDPRRALFALIVLLAVVLTAILVFSVSSCVSGKTQAPSTGQLVPVGTTGQQGSATTDDDEDATVDDEPSQDADADPVETPTEEDTTGDDATGTSEGDASDPAEDGENDGEAAANDEDEAPKETLVKVAVSRGEVVWVEITSDGVSEVAQGITGPWEQTYNVHDSITVQVDNPDAVTVTENGERRDFSSRAGGLGSVTIEGTPLLETQDETQTGEQGDDSATTTDTTGQ